MQGSLLVMGMQVVGLCVQSVAGLGSVGWAGRLRCERVNGPGTVRGDGNLRTAGSLPLCVMCDCLCVGQPEDTRRECNLKRYPEK